MERRVMAELLRWKDRDDRMPLMVRGVRQCGKTHIIQEFGRRYFDNVVYVNLEKKRSLHKLFEGDDLDPHRIIRDLSRLMGVRIEPGKALIFLDEIQACPDAMTSLKYFCEEAPEYHIVSAGSLLGVRMSRKSSYPVGKVDVISMGPMDFREWLIAKGRGAIVEDIDASGPFDVSPPILLMLEYEFREYMFVGGMPRVVSKWIETGDEEAVRYEQERILDGYDSDFLKHVPDGDSLDVSQVWESIPEQLSCENSKFVFNHVRASSRSTELERAIGWLRDTGLVHKINCSVHPSVPLRSTENDRAFKLYMCDLGLLSCMMDMDLTYYTMESMRETLNPLFRGASAENFVCNELCNAYEPAYWKDGRYEVDFLVRSGYTIVPVEVKSGWRVRATSLKKYIDVFDPPSAIVLSMGPPEDGRVMKVPIYLAWTIPSILSRRADPPATHTEV